MRGPITFTISDEVGLLVDGFNDAPRILMTYNPPYYPELLAAYGFKGAMDLYAYKFDLIEQFGGTVDGFPPKLNRVVEKLKQRSSLTIRKIDMKHFDDDVEQIKVIYRAPGRRTGAKCPSPTARSPPSPNSSNKSWIPTWCSWWRSRARRLASA